MKTFLLAPLSLLFLLAACGGPDAAAPDEKSGAESAVETEAAATDESDAAPERKTLLTRQGVPGSIEGREAIELLPEDIKPALTKDSTVTLNDITRRSLENDKEFLAEYKNIRADALAAAANPDDAEARAKAEAGIEKLRVWRKKADDLREETLIATQKVRDSGESYSGEVLAGIERFPRDVVKSIDKEIARNTAVLNGESE